MDENQYKKMMEQVVLSDDRKQRILSDIKARQNISKIFFRTPRVLRYASVMVCLLLVMNASVYAAQKFDIAGKMENVFANLSGKDNVIDENSQMAIEKYGMQINKKVTLGEGELNFEAAIYDNYVVYIPFSFKGSNEKSTLEELTFDIEGKEEEGSNFRYYDNKENKDGLQTGYYIYISNAKLEKNNILEVKDNNQKKVAEISLMKAVSGEVIELTELPDGVKSMSISAISLDADGILKDLDTSDLAIKVILRDCSEVAYGKTGKVSTYDSDSGEYKLRYNFAAPIDLKNVDYVLLNVGKEEYKIPVK